MYRPWKDTNPRARDAFWRAAALTAGFAAVVLVLAFRFSNEPATLTLGSLAILIVGGGAGYFWVRFFRHRSGTSS